MVHCRKRGPRRPDAVDPVAVTVTVCCAVTDAGAV